MHLTTKGRFAVIAMIDLGRHSADQPTALSAISARQGLSLAYLEQLFMRLRRRQLVTSVRGLHGGYTLARPMQSITVADIVLAVDEPLDNTGCASKGHCQSAKATLQSHCAAHHLWANLNQHIMNYLQAITLDSLLNTAPTQALAFVTADADAGAVLRQQAPAHC